MLKLFLQLFAKDRILGSAAKIELFTATGVISAEVDSFNATPQHDKKKYHPLGEIGERTQLVYKSYELDFKIGKTDDQIALLFQAIDQALLAGQPAPRVRVTETIKHFDGNNEVWIYPDTVLADYKRAADNSEDEIKEDFKGYCTTRVKGY